MKWDFMIYRYSLHLCISVVNPITVESLLRNKSMVDTPRRRSMTFVPLGDDELPGTGALVGLDAEFVTLNQVGFSWDEHRRDCKRFEYTRKLNDEKFPRS